MPLPRGIFIAAVGSLLLAASGNPDLTCASSKDLGLLVECIRAHMPRKEPPGYVAPTPSQRADWRIVVNQMMQGSCDFAVPVSLSGIVQVRTFTDTGNRRNYCLLMEVRDQNGDGLVDNGFGTFIVYSKASRQLSHQAVHPIADSSTEKQAVTVFKDTDSRSFLMAGAHRDANSKESACLPPHPESDASHDSNTMVQATNEELLAYYGTASWFAIQWHGMDTSRCPSHVFPSHGLDIAPAPTDKIAVLRDRLLLHHPTWRVDLPGYGACILNATENVQGRLLNGVPAERVCCTPASSYTQKFIHIEQDPDDFRNPSNWIAPITDTFP
jgi:hypothetical protein